MKVKSKTKKIVAKRFKVTKNGTLLRGKQGGRHLRARKSKRQLRRFNVPGTVSKGMQTMIRRFLPYS